MKRRWLGLTLVLALLCAACGSAGTGERPEEGWASLWFLSAENGEEGSALKAESRVLPEGGERVEELMALLLAGPEGAELTSPFPQGTVLRSWQREGSLVCLDLSEAYGGLSGAGLTLADGCIALTVCQLPEVERVYLTVEGRPRPFRDQVLSPDDFLLVNGAGEERRREVRLWFLGEEALTYEERTVSLAMGDRPELVALQTLLEGPESGGLWPICPEGTTLLSLSRQKNRYTVDLSEQWLEGEEDPRRVWAIVETLAELDPDVEVLLRVEGQELKSCGGQELTEPLRSRLLREAEQG